MRKIAALILAAGMSATAPAAAPDHRAQAEEMLGQLTIDEKISLMMDASPAIPRLGIPQFNWWSEALHGVARAGNATVLPQAIGMAATFDDGAVREAFEPSSTSSAAAATSSAMRVWPSGPPTSTYSVTRGGAGDRRHTARTRGSRRPWAWPWSTACRAPRTRPI